MQAENLGPAERLIQSVLAYSDHLVHNRPGVTVNDPNSVTKVRWSPATYKEENGEKVVYRLDKQGKKTVRVRLGTLRDTDVVENGRVVASYRPAGIFPEVALWMYKQAVEIWQLDNEFAAKWASYAYKQDHRDLKCVLAALMLVQSRKGDPVREGAKVAFLDEDYRDVGEAMVLLDNKGDKYLDAKMLLRIYDLLRLPAIAQLNRELGFGRSARQPFLGRWDKAVEKWLRYREENPKLLEGLVKAGFRTKIMRLARCIGYKPTSPKFFETLRWKQAQSEAGHRAIAIGKAVAAAESWEGLTEQAICEKIVRERPGYKRIVGLVPPSVGVTRAIVAASIEAGCLSDKDLIIATPTLEELGLLKVQDIRERWEKAAKAADDMRAQNIKLRVKSKEVREKLEEAADKAVQKAVEEATRGLRIYFMVDISGSMQGAIERAKGHLAKFLQAFPEKQIHVAVFNTTGRVIKIKQNSAVGVENAFRGITAGGGTDYGAGIRILQGMKPEVDENGNRTEDVLMIWVGDERNRDTSCSTFEDAVRASGLNPMAFGLVQVAAPGTPLGSAVRETARRLQIPCFLIEERTFEDPYAIPRTIRALIAATPVGTPAATAMRVQRETLAEMIAKTDLLVKPAWAA